MDTQTHQEFMCTEKKPYEEAARGWPSTNQGERPQRTTTTSTLFLAFQPTELGGNKFVFFKPLSLWVLLGTDSEKTTCPIWTQRLKL